MPKVLRSRAFDAFVPDSEPGEELPNARLLPLDVIDPNPYQARQAFAPEKLEELATSIRAHGVLEPILVQAVEGERYRILAGERRYRAARAAGFSQIPAIIREDLSEAEAAFITATENLQRADLDIEDEARQFAYLLKLTNLSQRALAEKLGVGYQYISRRIRLLERPDLLAAIRSGQLTQRDALRVLGGTGIADPADAQHIDRADLTAPAPGASSTPTADCDTVSHAHASEHPAMQRGDVQAPLRDHDDPSFAPLPGSPSPAVRFGAGSGDPGCDTVSQDRADHSTTHGSHSAPADSDDPAALVERADLDDPAHAPGTGAAAFDPAPPVVPRWRYVEEAQRALQRIDARTIPPAERPAWLRQVTALEAQVAALKHTLAALEAGEAG